MNYYIDITLQPDAEMRENVLLNKVYTKLHKALCDQQSTSIGVSFPAYKILLGNVMRIHGELEALTKFQAVNWLGGLSGYCKVTGILPIPEALQYRVIARKQSTMTNAKLNRLIKRKTISTDEAKAYKAKMFAKGLDNPYFELESNSNGHMHRRYIQFSILLSNAIDGEFDQFGLSKTATVPWF
ncbi:type I-F CRISPR-associated endoribonuclease Cas6/Csy4 [Pseudoalteromonas sp. SWXJZ94C]|uniref:type I-F CRISPR-associated endoribonuclease Cas6/Csy4 n=1 Tax=Pseudoalteromonas sp. SWXJZ94C TaxID=2792065 RepID=UPI0018CCFAEA|nr:type I-F CRISPR-associated endoribonuclease Cas6/Csy4 [Pseudoalteromonas sp. SWXJZ94C]MBH0058574.1 type I-F CRISPR-associated endoribonuclease Cas6/Csy4 [Pseudoalteromonas sp. SWXJZ94C]